jgi:PP-loop superfamily ATP-utilizing enzyme
MPGKAGTRLADRSLRTRIVNELAALGFAFVTVDLAGNRRGVFDRKPLTSK